jgi:hypothetical protein
MAKAYSIFQPIYDEDRHVNAISDLLSEKAEEVVLSVAFVREEGVHSLVKALSVNAKNTRIYIGVRNGITTLQGIRALLKTGVSVYAVDTGYGAAIFHPKFFCSLQKTEAKIIIGSANLTFSGLNNNVEASARLVLARADKGDEGFLQHFLGGLKRLRKDFTNHCYSVKDETQARLMLDDGLIEDENASPPDTAPRSGRPPAKKPKYLSRIGLKFTSLPKRQGSKKTRVKASAAPGKPISSGAPAFGPLVWEKPALPKGDLQLLTQGHGSGVLRLTQAGFEVDGAVIDQTAYFRADVFGGLAWASGPKGKEVATSAFALVVSGVYLGTFDLGISHKAAWEAGQGNYTTGLHWGDAVALIRKPELIGRTLRLYQPVGTSAPFVIEID